MVLVLHLVLVQALVWGPGPGPMGPGHRSDNSWPSSCVEPTRLACDQCLPTQSVLCQRLSILKGDSKLSEASFKKIDPTAVGLGLFYPVALQLNARMAFVGCSGVRKGFTLDRSAVADN